MKTTVRITALLSCLAMSLPSFAAPVSTFVAAVTEGDTSWLLSRGGGSLFVQRGSAAPAKAVTFHGDHTAVFPWHPEPHSFARLGGGWVVANSTSYVWHFSADGHFVDAVQAPGLITEVASSGGLLWLYSAAAPAGGDALWTSSDGRHFTAVPAAMRKAATPQENAIAAELVLAAGPQRELAFAHAAGAPQLTIAAPNGKLRNFALAYSRTKARSQLLTYRFDAAVVSYSEPVRDLILDKADVYVLRNREDVIDHGQTVTVRALRADRYSADGRHLATARFPSTVRFLLRATPANVVGLTDTDAVVVAPFGAPVPGGVIP